MRWIISLGFSLFAQVAAAAEGNSLSRNIEAFIAEKETPGLVLMIVKNGRVLLHEAYGFSDRESRQPLRKDAIFRWYSMTKPITAAGFLKLVESGRLSLDTPLPALLPSFRQAEGVTMRQLLTHTAGFAYGGSWDSLAGWRYALANPMDQEGKTLNESMAALAELPLMHEPGAQWLYGMASDVQGAVIEAASGEALADYLVRAVLRPLGMNDTGFFVPPAKQARLVPQYAMLRLPFYRKIYRDDGEGGSFLAPPRLVSGGGGLVGTAEDYMRFVQWLLHPETRPGVLAPELVRAMRSNQLPPAIPAIPEEIYSNSGYGFGLGVKLVDEPGLGRGSFYWAGAGGTLFWADPGQDLAVVAMMQLDGARKGLEKRLLPWIDAWLRESGHGPDATGKTPGSNP